MSLLSVQPNAVVRITINSAILIFSDLFYQGFSRQGENNENPIGCRQIPHEVRTTSIMEVRNLVDYCFQVFAIFSGTSPGDRFELLIKMR